MYLLTADITFPELSEADTDGLLAVGGDLSVARLIYAYQHGIFPWFGENEPILWWAPNPRFVLFPHKLKISKSMKQILRNNEFTFTVNKAFKDVISACSQVERHGKKETWITDTMLEAYIKLHELGYAKSAEVWKGEELVGGLYGVDVNNGVFCGESMFSKISNASKVALIAWIQHTNYQLIDCQVYTKHLESLGAEDLSRAHFLTYLNA